MPSARETVLLVDDNDVVRGFIRHVLVSSGYSVQEARDGCEALQIDESYQEPIHLLLTDLVMPNLGGWELAERLLPHRPKMKVLYISGFTDDAVTRRGMQTGEVAFLQKPFSPTALADKVRAVLDN